MEAMQQMQVRLEELTAQRNIGDGDVSDPDVETEEEEETIAANPEMRFFQSVLRSIGRSKT